MLTKGLDNIQGTAGNDTIIGSITAVPGTGELDTLSALDVINGGAGKDTLKIASSLTAATSVPMANISNVEVVEIEGTAGVTVDTSAVAGVTNLNVTKAAGAVAATAAATTDVSVSIKDSNFAAATDHTVTNGNNVTFNFTDAGAALVANADDIAITGAKGNVVVNATAKAADNAAATLAMGTIGVTGGKTVSVTQKAGDAAGLVAGSAATTHTQGDVTVTADATTTDVTVKQDKAATAASVAAVTGATEVASVKFTKLDAGESVTISGLTFTAAAGKNLTAEQVAQAFANLSASAIKPTQIAGAPATATGDTQGSGANANGTFTGTLVAGWTSGAATGDTVVFTGTANTAMAVDLVASAKATVTTTTQGVTAVPAQNTLGVANGTVTIAGAAALKTVTVDGYAASTGAAGINGTTNTALDTISLANGGNFEIDSAAATLGLTLNKVNGTVTVTAGTKTLNADVNGAATDTVTLVSGSAEAINVTGAGNVAGTTATGLTAATAINTTGMTAGNATFTIANGTTTSYTGGAGVDSVTVTNAATAITKGIDLGAGDDTLTLNGAAIAPTATLKGGDGTDTISMTGARAEALSANTTFAGKIEGFEKLYINDTVAAATTVNMANMDGITYVVSNGTAAVGAAATKEVITIDFATSGTIKGADTVLFDGQTTTLASDMTPAQIALAFAGKTYATWDLTSVAGSVVTLTAKNPGLTADVTTANFTINDVDATTAAVAVTKTTDGTTTYTFDLTGIALYDTDTFAIGGTTVWTAPSVSTLQNTAAVIAGAVGASPVTIGGVAYAVTSTVANTLVLTTTDAAAPANLTYTATDTGADGNGFAAGAGSATPVAKANGVAEVFAAEFATSGAIEDGDIIVFDGVTITLASGDTPANIATKIAAGVYPNWTGVAAGTAVNFTAATAGAKVDAANGNFVITNVQNPATKPAVAVAVTTQGAAAGAGVAALTLDKMANNGTVELLDAAGNNFGGANSAGVIVKMADATGSTDSLNLVTKVSAADATFGTVDVAGVETLKLNAVDTTPVNAAGAATISTASLAVKADKATSLTIEGNSHVTLTLDATTTKLATIDAGTLTGTLNAGNTLNAVAMTITGGKGADVLKASVGATAKADVLNGGDGNDTLVAGSNGAKLTGGAGNDTFLVTATATTDGNKESNTYSDILDFQAGDVLQLQYSNAGVVADVLGFAKLAATLNENTAVFSDFVNAAIKEAAVGAAVYFNYKGDAYVVVDSNVNSAADTFINGEDLVVKLTGINGDNLSWNSDYATVALI